VQQQRLAFSIATNPLVINTRKEFRLRSRESALYLSIFGDPLTGVASKQCVYRSTQELGVRRIQLNSTSFARLVQIFFREERLPVAEGWTKPTTLITIATLTPLESAIAKASNWTASQPCEPLRLGPNLTL
jgi:hypothetical protein